MDITWEAETVNCERIKTRYVIAYNVALRQSIHIGFSSHLNYVATLPCETTLFILDVRSQYVSWLSWNQNDEQVAAQLKNEWIIETITVKAGAQNVLRVRCRHCATASSMMFSAVLTVRFRPLPLLRLTEPVSSIFRINFFKPMSTIYSEIQSSTALHHNVSPVSDL